LPAMPRRPTVLAALVAALTISACGSSSSSTTSSSHAASSAAASSQTTASTQTVNNGSPNGPEGVPLEAGPTLAPASTTSTSRDVDGVKCAPIEQLAYHIHAHLQVYVNGLPYALPGAIGMIDPVAEQTAYGPFYGAEGCYYWLHTHASDGVIHIESPTQKIYTLGQFFDEWGQPLTGDDVAGHKGTVSAIVNGKPWTITPRDIPLTPHATIQLAVGQPIPPFHTVDWAKTEL
jgi:hypothetical protein